MAFVPVFIQGGLALKSLAAPLLAGATVGTFAGKMTFDSYSRPATYLQVPPIIKYIERQRSTTKPDPSTTTESVKIKISFEPPSGRRSTTERNSARDDDDEEIRPKDPRNLEDDLVAKHILSRLLLFIRFAGVIQRISLAADIARGDVFLSEASQYRDSSSHESGYHAAHVIMAGRIDSRIQNNHPELYNDLRNYTDHTQIVPAYANARYGLGGGMNRLQSKFFNRLATIDFSRSKPTEEAQNILHQFGAAFINLLDQEIDSERYSAAEISGLECAKKDISDLKEEKLFEEGRDGYNGRHSSN